ncbi:MAG TPA: CoA transferase [Thermodesulfobacteriota bacterium]|nr:CoA transferase [Thermodesulfobacteriota bacterium]
MKGTQTASRRILEGIRVLDLSTLITGPYCASLLGDLGGEVIKVEHPRGGDGGRQVGSTFLEGESALFLAINRNKKDLTLALDKPAGQEILRRLIARADVLIENFRPDIGRQYQLDYEQVRAIRPDIIYLSITGFGEEGPYRLKPGTDHIFQGLSGLATISGKLGQGPIRVGTPVVDMTASLYSCLGVVSALLHRQRTGQGQQICVNLLDAAMCVQSPLFTEYFITGHRPTPTGNASPFAYPVDIFPSADGNVSIGAFNDKFWRNLCRALNLDSLADDPWFNTPEKRLSNREELGSLLSKVLATRKTREWLKILEEADVPCGPVHDYDAVFSDPQVLHNQLVKTLPHSRLNEVRTLGNPISFSQTPAREERSAPLLGEDTDSILHSLGYKPEEVKEFREKKII